MKAGLEVHQQLATEKLFCECPSELSEVVVRSVTRRLRATSGENHAVDRAAALQASKRLDFRYEASSTSCLVELDEEPPHALDPEALDVALTVALMLHARPVDEVVVMRKIVVDGSNTAGFQRTALIAVDGRLELGDRHYSIISICLEEDAARKVGETPGGITFRLDRLGIPLVEIATGPEITGGPEAREVAEELGAILRATRKVRRGIGTIREDLNVSTHGGTRVEIKGIQELRLLHKYAALEEGRQRTLLDATAALRERGARAPEGPTVDLTELLRPVATGGLGDALRKGGIARGIRLERFAGLLRPDPNAEERLGRELADLARSTGLRGLVHSDELPGYGLVGPVLEAVRSALGATDPLDAFVIVGAPDAAHADRALDLIRDRATIALTGIPGETRDPLPEGRSRYSRPLPGRDRMYPETDVPPVPIRPEHLERLRAALPDAPMEARRKLSERHGLPGEIVRQLQRADQIGTFESLVAAGHPATLVARLLTQEIPAAQPETTEGAPEVELSDATLAELLRAVRDGRFSKEGLGPVLKALLKGAPDLPAAIAAAGLGSVSSEDLQRLAAEIVRRNADLIAARGAEAFAPLMGDLMREVRGKRDGREVAEALRAALAAVRSDAGSKGA